MPDDLLSELRAAISNKRAVLFVGAGVSLASCGDRRASWRGLLHSAIERLRMLKEDDKWLAHMEAKLKSENLRDLIGVAESLQSRLIDHGRGEFGGWLRNTVGSFILRSPELAEALLSLDIPVVTTNYDGLLETAGSSRTINWVDAARIERFVRGDETGIVHLHGYWERPKSVVLGVKDYRTILNDEFTQTLMRSYLMRSIILFVGFGAGLEDPNFSRLIDWAVANLGDTEYRHFRLCLDREALALNQDRELHQHHIYPIPYGSTHDQLTPFIKRLAPKRTGARKSERRDELPRRSRRISSCKICLWIDGEFRYGGDLDSSRIEDLDPPKTSIIGLIDPCDGQSNRIFCELVNAGMRVRTFRKEVPRAHAALDELLTNVRQHAYTNSPRPFFVRVRLFRKRLDLELRNPKGVKFNVHRCFKQARVALWQNPERQRGRGLILVNTLVDGMESAGRGRGIRIDISKVRRTSWISVSVKSDVLYIRIARGLKGGVFDEEASQDVVSGLRELVAAHPLFVFMLELPVHVTSCAWGILVILKQELGKAGNERLGLIVVPGVLAVMEVTRLNRTFIHGASAAEVIEKLGRPEMTEWVSTTQARATLDIPYL